jgi:hypothetical protein
LIGLCGSLFDEALTTPVKCQYGLLLSGFDRHEPMLGRVTASQPALILSKGLRTLLFIEGCRLCHAVVGPALKAGHLRQIAIMAERRQIFRSEPAQQQPGCWQKNPFLLLNETGNGGAILTCAASTQPSHFLENFFQIDSKVLTIKHYNNKYEKQGNKPERRLWKKEPCATAKRMVSTAGP